MRLCGVRGVLHFSLYLVTRVVVEFTQLQLRLSQRRAFCFVIMKTKRELDILQLRNF